MGLSGKVALITGSARGIGKAIALELAHHGANIVINDILPKNEIDKTLREIKKSGNIAIGIKADITVFDEVNRMVKEIINKFEKIDILVNNAGITRDSLLSQSLCYHSINFIKYSYISFYPNRHITTFFDFSQSFINFTFW